jgi:hypothetical protein
MAVTQPQQLTPRHGPRRRTGRAGGLVFALEIALLFLRIAIIVTVWLGLFLAAFFGYLTVPFVVLLVFIAGYAVLDRVRVRQRREAERRRKILDEPVPDPIYGPDPRT